MDAYIVFTYYNKNNAVTTHQKYNLLYIPQDMQMLLLNLACYGIITMKNVD